MAERALKLVRLTIAIQPKEAVSRFLVAASRCYIVGLHAESAIMCGAALENGLDDRYSIARLSPPQNSKGQVTFDSKIGGAVRAGWLLENQRGRAKEVWLRRSKSAHADPTLVPDALATISTTATLLERGGRRSSRPAADASRRRSRPLLQAPPKGAGLAPVEFADVVDSRSVRSLAPAAV